MEFVEENYYIIKLAYGGDWGGISAVIRSLKGRKGLSMSYNDYSKVYTVVVWDEDANEAVKSLQSEVEDAGGVWKVAV